MQSYIVFMNFASFLQYLFLNLCITLVPYTVVSFFIAMQSYIVFMNFASNLLNLFSAINKILNKSFLSDLRRLNF